MKVLQTLMCFFFLSLWDGNTGFMEAEIHTGTEGGNITVSCNFLFTGDKRIFCRRECEGEDLLVETTGSSAQRGRYSIQHKAAVALFFPVMNVTITNLTKSDSGRYRCRLHRKFQPDSKEDFEIRVQSEDARVTSKPKPNLRPSTSTPTTTHSLISSPGSSTHPSASPETTNQPPTTNQPEHPQPAAGGLLYVGLTLVVMIIILSAAMVILLKKRARKSKEPPEEAEYVNVTEANRDYEIIEDKPNRSGPVELFTVYTCASITEPNAVETTAANCVN
uniref:uncharacterized protein LOC124062907 isoform X3 n=1 Tax=Scatophagus argus TaxID=75038 RepID=UPI001ED7F659|nr:uncharacterized protein LOC124062907 isoform X3 [Scatophagus argus]